VSLLGTSVKAQNRRQPAGAAKVLPIARGG
jgi:hypothetical protein